MTSKKLASMEEHSNPSSLILYCKALTTHVVSKSQLNCRFFAEQWNFILFHFGAFSSFSNTSVPTFFDSRMIFFFFPFCLDHPVIRLVLNTTCESFGLKFLIHEKKKKFQTKVFFLLIVPSNEMLLFVKLFLCPF